MRGQRDSVLYFSKLYIALNDSIYGPRKFHELQLIMITEQQRRLDEEKQLLATEALEKEEKRKIEESKKALLTNIKVYALLSGLAILAIIGIILYRNNLSRKKTNDLLQHKNRELEIESAVEKVRATALAMSSPQDFMHVALTLQMQLSALKVQGIFAATIYIRQDNGKFRMWDFTTDDQYENVLRTKLDYEFRMEDLPEGLYIKRVLEHSGSYSVYVLERKDMSIVVDWIRQFNEKVALEIERSIEDYNPARTWHPSVKLEQGRMSIDMTEAPAPEVKTILTKMGAAFDLAYTRFQDIQKAETQAKEARIETALERIRSRSMAMQKSTELRELVLVIFQQMQNFGFNLNHLQLSVG